MERRTQEQAAAAEIPPALFRLVDFKQDKAEWSGTATELAAAMGETRAAPNALTKWMNEYRTGFLAENHIRYDYHRKNSGRLILLARQDKGGGDDGDGSDGSDGVFRMPPATVTDTEGVC